MANRPERTGWRRRSLIPSPFIAITGRSTRAGRPETFTAKPLRIRPCWSNLAQPPLEKSPLALVSNQLERPCIAPGRLWHRAQAPQQVSARCMQQVVVVEVPAGPERIDQLKARLRPF